MDTVERKRGKLSAEEEALIRQNVELLPAQKIAMMINRTEETVQKFIRQNSLISSSMDDKEATKVALRAKLHTRDYWLEVLKQFSESELEFFESLWTELMIQFREDVLFSEELELKQYITLEIFINRNVEEQKRARLDVERIQKELDKEYAKPGEDRDMPLINNLEGQLSFARTAIPAYASEYVKLLDKRGAVTNSLKATRDQRVKKIEDSKSSWAGFIKALDDEAFRERIGDDAELNKIARDAAEERLAEYHTFVDGKIDRPLLNADTIEKE
jgi:hypothetical protein